MRIGIAVLLLICCAASAVAQESDIVERLMPGGVVDIPRIKSAPRKESIAELGKVQADATGKRRQQIAFLLAALDSEYKKNSKILLDVLKTCSAPQTECDQQTIEYLEALYWLGHRDVLAPLMESASTSDGTMAQSLGVFLGDVLLKSSRDFLDRLAQVSSAEGKNVCFLTAAANAGGAAPERLEKIRGALMFSAERLGQRCLRQMDRVKVSVQKP